ncbi:class I SAM-dependent methyltransferase [Streptomyces sp. KL116D]|uniref:class I SAM-dependent methyltransferase n=1 Tax=Streptomyces sp. KL116D TaxID=3045152 RepID=UPI00355922CA
MRRLYGREIAGARSGVLDIGAGTGRVTMLALADSWADVHAVEPARAMRTSLLTRLATLPAEQRDRVTVHPHPLDETALDAVADAAVCHNMIGCLPPAVRERLWSAIGRALTPDGSLFLQLPPARLPVRTVVRLLADKRVGAHVYGGVHDDVGRRLPHPHPRRLLGQDRGRRAAGAHRDVLDVARDARPARRRTGPCTDSSRCRAATTRSCWP